jgi:hypothetical protein
MSKKKKSKKSKKPASHGMQLGQAGYGLTHGYSDKDVANRDVRHETKGS